MVTNAKHRELIETFLAGEIGLDDLTRRLPGALADSPATAADHRAYLDELRMAGRLPPQLHAMLWEVRPAAEPDPVAAAIETPLPSAKGRRGKSQDNTPSTPSPLEQLLEGAMPARTIVPGGGGGAPPEVFPVAEAAEAEISPEAIDLAQPAVLPNSQPISETAPMPAPAALAQAPDPVVEAYVPPPVANAFMESAPVESAPVEGALGQNAPAGSPPVMAPYRNAEPDAGAATQLLPDDYDPMEGLPTSTPEPIPQPSPPAPEPTPRNTAAAVPDANEAVADNADVKGVVVEEKLEEKTPTAAPLPSSLLPEAELEVDELPPETYPKPRKAMESGDMPLPNRGGNAAQEKPSADDADSDTASAVDTPDIGTEDDPANAAEAQVDEAIFAKYLSTYRNLKNQRQHDTDSGDGQKLDALLQPWQTIRFRRDAAKLADGDTDAVGEFGLEDEEGPADVGPGDIVNKRFVIERVLGEGGMGTVYKAVDRRQLEAKSRNPFVALKLLSHDFRRHPEAYRALERETRKAQILAHPNIVTVFDFDRDGRVAYMTMELLEGSPLSRMINSHGDAVSWEIALPIVTGVGAALSYAHEQGIVHADIKPGNIFFTNDGRAKLLDFGIAQAFRESVQSSTAGITADDGLAGALTPGFASVEMLENMPAAPKDDIYAFACVIYEMLAGRHPFDGKTASEAEANGETPEPIDGLSKKQNAALAHGLAFRRENRPDTMPSFIEELIGEKRGWFGR